MKTRKYKDNQQRKNFARNESSILLIQYFKKMRECNTNKLVINSTQLTPTGLEHSSSQITSIKRSATLGIDRLKWSNFRYSNNLSRIFDSEKSILKSNFYLIQLKNQVGLLSNASATTGCDNKIRYLAKKICYGPVGSQQLQTKTRIRGRCIQSNRPRSVSRLLRLSRIRVRSLALKGKITGCTRSTW